MGLGSMETTTPNSSATRWRRKRAIQRSSPISMPSQGPTWNSHWAGITSAFVPLMFTPAYRQVLREIHRLGGRPKSTDDDR